VWSVDRKLREATILSLARTYLPRTIKKTDLILGGRTKAQMVGTVAAAVGKKELPMELGTMCYMLSKRFWFKSDREMGLTAIMIEDESVASI
jgi:hypothetical protein